MRLPARGAAKAVSRLSAPGERRASQLPPQAPRKACPRCEDECAPDASVCGSCGWDYRAARQASREAKAALWRSCRFAYLTPDKLWQAMSSAERVGIPMRRVQLGMLARVFRLEYEQMPAGTGRQIAEKKHLEFVSANSSNAGTVGAREGKGDWLRPRRN